MIWLIKLVTYGMGIGTVLLINASEPQHMDTSKAKKSKCVMYCEKDYERCRRRCPLDKYGGKGRCGIRCREDGRSCVKRCRDLKLP